MKSYHVNFVAANGDACSHDYLRWLDAYRTIDSIRGLYEAQGYKCADDEETWICGWERKHVFTKEGHPDRFIEYYLKNIEL